MSTIAINLVDWIVENNIIRGEIAHSKT
jgi:hypothetical protein